VGAYLRSENRAGGAASQIPALAPPTERKWDVAFLGILAYMVIEYTRLPLMYPVLQHFDVAKVAAGISLLGLLLSPRVSKGPGTSGIDICVVLFLVASVVSAAFADYSGAAWNQAIDSLKWVVIYFLISRIVTSPWRSKVFAVVLLLLNLKLAQFSVRTYLAYGSVTRGGDTFAMVGMGANDFFGNSNDFGTGMCIVLPLAACLFLGESKTIARAYYLVCFLGILAAMLLSGCRGAFVATVASLLVFFVRSEKKGIAILMGFLLLVGTLVVLPGGNWDRLRSAMNPDEDQTASQRIGFWKAGLRMFRDHPITGVGPANFAPNYRDRYFGSDPYPRAWAPHSIFLQAFAELGIIGALPLFMLWYLTLRLNTRTRKLLKESGLEQQSFDLRLALGLELALVAFFVSGSFLTILYYPHLWFLLGMSAGLQASALQIHRERGIVPGQELENSMALAAS
jgi:probable O-glycosylation ligase (exosortase A-associated)